MLSSIRPVSVEAKRFPAMRKPRQPRREAFRIAENLASLAGKLSALRKTPPASPGSFPHAGKPRQPRREAFRIAGNPASLAGKLSALRENLASLAGKLSARGETPLFRRKTFIRYIWTLNKKIWRLITNEITD